MHLHDGGQQGGRHRQQRHEDDQGETAVLQVIDGGEDDEDDEQTQTVGDLLDVVAIHGDSLVHVRIALEGVGEGKRVVNIGRVDINSAALLCHDGHHADTEDSKLKHHGTSEEIYVILRIYQYLGMGIHGIQLYRRKIKECISRARYLSTYIWYKQHDFRFDSQQGDPKQSH